MSYRSNDDPDLLNVQDFPSCCGIDVYTDLPTMDDYYFIQLAREAWGKKTNWDWTKRFPEDKETSDKLIAKERERFNKRFAAEMSKELARTKREAGCVLASHIKGSPIVDILIKDFGFQKMAEFYNPNSSNTVVLLMKVLHKTKPVKKSTKRAGVNAPQHVGV